MQLIAATAGICMLLTVSASDAATCRANLQSSTPTVRFLTTSEVVNDQETTLSWTRCAIGQTWENSACKGEPTAMNWDEAVALVDEFNLDGMNGQDDWRLPKVPELASIVERQCFNPRVNETVFPGAPSVLFWSSMEKKGETDYVYALDFGAGAAQATRKDSKGAVRLVRGGPWGTPPKMSDSQ